jgi:AbrB family looped-hinge helix DNA binding protein
MDARTKKKTEIAERMFVRPEGATMQEIIAATGGPQYNKLKQLEGRGYVIRKVKERGETRYFAMPPEARTYEATMTSKGQVTLPKEVRDLLRLNEGQKLCFTVEDGNRAVMTPQWRRLSDLVGILPKPKRRVTLEEMDQAIADGIVDRYLRAVGKKR